MTTLLDLLIGLATPPQTPLQAFQIRSGYLTWDNVTVESEALRHHRRLYYHPEKSIFVADTLDKDGAVAVVEVIELRGADTEFRMFDPRTGARLKRYPKNVQFPVRGMPGATENLDEPEICLACHIADQPLIRPILQTPESVRKIQVLRAARRGFAFRLGTVKVLDAKKGDLAALEAALQRTPDRVFDLIRANEKRLGRPL